MATQTTTQATSAPASAPAGAPASAQAQPQNATPAIPFVRAAHEHNEPFQDQSNILQAGSLSLPPDDVPAYGYLKNVVIRLDATGGVGGGANVAATQDAPWDSISQVMLLDVNGNPMVNLPGYSLYLANKYGGYRFNPDPQNLPLFSAVATGVGATGNFAAMLRVPVEIRPRDALGALPNQSAASPYKLAKTQSPSGQIYTTPPATTLPTLRIREWLEAWTQPNAQDLAQRPQQTAPPQLGTTQFWTQVPFNVNAGQQTVRFSRMGNLIRTLIMVWRRTDTGLRDDASFPDPIEIFWDGRLIINEQRDLRKCYMAERYGFAPAAVDTGVFVYDFTHDFDGHPGGGELADLWLQTTQGSRIELQGNFGTAGTLTVITNDIQPTGDVYMPVAG